MKSANELLAANGHRETWIPLLEMATREVFELMLSCQADRCPNPRGAHPGSYCHGRIGRPTVRRAQRALR